LQQQQQQQDRNVQAGTDQEADRVRAVQPVKVKPLPEYGPARMCEEAWRDGAAAFIADMAGIRGAALQAADVVALKDGRPVFEAQPEDLPVSALNAPRVVRSRQGAHYNIPSWEVAFAPACPQSFL
jgi:hypothetical protein